MKQRYSLKSNAVKFRAFALLLVALLTGGNVVYADNWPTPSGIQPTTLSTSKTYYIYSSDMVNTGDGAGTYKFYLLGEEVNPSTHDFTNDTLYEYFSACIIDGGQNASTNGSGIHIKLVFNTSKPVGFVGFFCINDGTLEMNLGQYYTNTNGITLKRTGGHSTYSNSNYNCPFTIPDNYGGNSNSSISFDYNSNEKNLDAQKIIITGNNPLANELVTYPNSGYVPTVETDTSTFLPTRQFVIDGGCVPTLTETGSGSTAGYNINYNGTQGRTTFFRVMCGTLQLTNVTLQNCSATSGHAGAIYVITNSGTERKSSVKVDLEHCWIHHCANGYPGIYIQYGITKYTGTATTPPTVTINRSKFSDCYATFANKNAAIRSFSNGLCNLTMNKCTVLNNYGGGVRWQSTRPCTATFNNCLIKKNKAYGNPSSSDAAQGSGGGLLIKSSATINGCLIRDNWAQVSGGGIYYTAFEEHAGNTVYEPEHGLLTFDMDPNLGTTVIEKNEAVNHGGGIAVMAQRMRARPYYYGYTNGVLSGQYTMTFRLHGATVRNNTALTGNGGGVYISRAADASFYETTCNLDYGNIYNNNALNGYGGGVCVQSLIGDPGVTPSNIYPTDIIVTTGVNEGSNSMQVYNNDAQKGAGIYVEAYPVTYNGTTSKVTTTLYNGTDIHNNDATTDGGGLYVEQGLVTIAGSGTTNLPYIHQNQTGTNGNGGGIFLNNGNIEMRSATIGGVDETDPQNPVGLGNIAGTSGGGVYVNQGSVNMVSSVVKYNQATAGNGGGIYVNTGDVFINRTEQGGITPSQITYNKAHNGGGIYNHAGSILAFGTLGGGENLHVQINNNQATAGSGGGIYCTGDATTTSYDIRLRRVDIKSNTATENGGGIYLGQGKISVVIGIIDGNSASGNGGGVYTHQGNIDINPTGDERNATQITNNTATINGGGLNTHHGFITVQGNSKAQRVIIKNNVATTGSGGAIFCMGENTNAEYITVRHTDLVSNKAELGTATYGTGSEVAAGCGGGIYLQQGKITITDVNIQNNYAKVNGGGINNHSGNIDVNGCYIGSSHSTSGDHYYKADAADGDTDRGNKADNSGGGIYTRLGDIDIEDYVETSGNIFREESKVTFNEAAKNGGGIDTHEGIIYINKEEEDDQIEVAFNKAERGGGLYANAGTIVTYNAQIHDNTATLHGGGANNHSGNIIIYGGMLSNNTAKEGHGGGAYTNVGDIDLFQFPSTNLNPNLNHGTKVYNNIAKLNGGAFNNHTGRVDVRHATIYNNTATLGNGGAIFCEGPHANVDHGLGYTIRLLCSDMVQNKTRGQDGTATDPTGRGGGIYLKYGSIYAHYSNIRDNEANIAGGGLNNHEGNILLYGCDITGNRALELDGGGIFIKSGSITTGPSTVREASPTSAKATIVQNNTAYRNGGGIINLNGNITLNGDLIGGATSNLGNKALTGNGGGVYIANGIINMKGGQIDNNTAEHGKGGGVYSGGGEFNIGEREENPSPIVLLVDTEVKRVTGGQTATVHYHLVDQGNYSSVTDVEHGILWGITENPTTEVVYDSQAGTESGYTYTQGEPACERIIIPSSMITAGTTYYAKAFYRYTTGGNVITGYSETIKFVTFSNSEPLVISGAVSNITKNSAQGSGRVMDNGGSAITERGVQIWTGDTPPANDQGLVQSSETTEFFTVDLTGLTPNTPYHARAYAKNENNQIAFGNTVDFTTLKDTPDMGNGLVTVSTCINENNVIVATASFTMPAGTTFGTGANDVKAYGFVWSRDDDPELVSDHTVAGTLTTGTTFTATYTGVTPGITFYVRAYASTIESEVNSSSDITKYSITAATQHVAPMLDGSPVVRAIEISGITQNSATITCQIYSGYEARATQYGVHLDNYTETNPANTYTSAFIPSNNATPNDPEHQIYYPYTYTVQLTNLKPGTTYYLKAYGTNVSNPTSDDDYNFGNSYNFTALPVMQPNVVVKTINYYYDAEHPENTDHTKVDVVCRIVNDGGEAISQNNYGINYGDFQTNSQTGDLEPVAATNSPIRPNVELSSDEFTITLTGLTAHKDYWVSAFATNSAGTHTCQTVTFTTNYDHPSVAFTTTNPISGVDFSITDNGNNNYTYEYTAVGNYTVTPNATSGEAVKTHGVCWSIFRNPTRRISAVSDSHYAETTEEITSQTPKSTTFHPAYPNTKYYVHAYVSTSTPDANNELADIVYDPVDPNITFVSLPIVRTGGATAITNSSASLTVNINSPDREYHLRKYGVCWVVRTNGDEIPTRTAGYYVEGDITAANPTAVSYTLTANVGADEGTSKTYRYRAYCINENSDAQGNIAYGDIKEFTTTAYTITGTTNPTEAGWVSYGGNLTTGGGWDGSSSITVEAHTNDGWHFENWTLDNGTSSHSSDNPLTETPNAGNHTYQANFKAIVSATVNPENTGTVSGAGNYAVGTTCTLTATAESGYTFLYWTDDAGNIIMDATGDTPEDNTYAFTVVGPVTVTANFTSRNRSTNNNSTINAPRSRDIYPAPAREPWDWDEETIPTDTTKAPAMTDTLPERHICTTEAPRNIPMIDHNTAEFGGGVYVDYTKGEGNTEPTKLYFSGGNSNEKRGKIIFNYASRAGGGIYLADSAYMQMKGYCEVNGNRVPADSLGGGIYLSGRLYVGKPGDGTTVNSLMVNQNFAITDASFETNYVGHEDDYTNTNKFKRNNIYLPKDTYSYATGNNASTNDNSNVITLLADISAKNTTTNTYYSNMGFSVPHGYCPVITTAATFGGDYLKQGDENFSTIYEPWMSKLMPAYDTVNQTYWNSSALFDDSESHIAIHTETDIDPFRAKYIFLWGSWTNPKVDEDPQAEGTQMLAGDGTHYKITKDNDNILHWEIYSPEGLSWFSSYINGLNAFAADAPNDGVHDNFKYKSTITPYATAKLMNDIDMSAAFWVPLGSVTSYDGSVYHDEGTHTFKGSFDGQGYIITGLDCRFLTGVNKYGLFGKLDGEAVVKNVFIDDSKYTTIDENAPYYVGGVAGVLSDRATISASEARVVMDVNKANKAESYVGGLVGKAEGTTTNPSIIHSSMAMPEIIGTVDYMGGLVGQLGANNKLLNSFSNPKFPESNNNYHPMSTGKFIGGLVGENNGIVENCYSRLQGNEPTSDGTKSVFGWLAGTNTAEASSGDAMGGIRFCYIPKGKNVYVKAIQPDGIINQDFGSGINVGNEAPYGHGKYDSTLRISGKYGFKHRDHKMYDKDETLVATDYTKYVNSTINDTLVGGLMHALNHWVDTANKVTTTYAKWTRTMASPINDDYPVPVLTDFNAVGSIDSIYMHYKHDVNDLLNTYTELDEDEYPHPAIYLYDTILNGSTPVHITTSNINRSHSKVMLAINEDLGILQDVPLKARVGVTIKNNRKVNDFTDDPNWHLFSSAIEDVPMGLDYHTDTTYSNYTYQPPYDGTKYSTNIPNKPKHSQSIWGNRNYFDPPQTTWWQSDNVGAISYNANGSKIGYFPTNTPYGTWRPGFEGGQHASDPNVGGFFDLYCYSEEFFHWINFKREGSSTWKDHWHMDGDHNQDHWRLDYGYNLPTPTGENPYSFTLGNEPYLLTGKGYMMALSSESMMMADGQLNTGNVYAPVTLTPVGTHCVTPYNYDEPWRTLNLVGNPYQSYLDFVKLIADDNNKGLLYCDSYATREDISKEFIFYTEQQSKNDPELMASQYIHPHQGFFIKVKAKGNLKFTDAMRVAGTNTSLGSDFRDINYPLVNLICYEPSGHRNFTTVEVNRPSVGGGSKMQNLRTGYASIYAHFEDKDYQTLFTPVGVSTVPVWFETEENGVYTLRWNTLHGYFNYLHLIDHIMGTDIDCLTTDEYKFEAKASDYKSRFRLVFDCVGVEEYEEDDLNSATFAFQMGDELIINGEGMLQMFDVSGRCLMSTRTMGQQSSVNLPKTAAGVYLLRLTTNSEVKVQKMVIK